MGEWPDRLRGQIAEWLDCLVARSPRGKIAEWPDCRVARLTNGQIAEWPDRLSSEIAE